MKHLLSLLILISGLSTCSFAQKQKEEYESKKNISDTLLKQTRTLLVPEPFNAKKVMLQLFPGQYYNLSEGTYKDELVNWECKTCKPKVYDDVNQDVVSAFPFKAGVATRILNVLDYKDSKGIQYKVINFNHSEFDPEGLTTSRFTGGLVGLAKFNLTPAGWKLTFFQPAIQSYGAFSRSPAPKLVMIGEDQYAFMIKHSNGGGGGPFDGHFFLIAGAGGRYQQIMAAYGIERTEVSEEEGLCAWTSEYTVPVSSKKYFRDILITTKGHYTLQDKTNLPKEVQKRLTNHKKGTFSMEERYVYKGNKGYELQPVVKVVVN